MIHYGDQHLELPALVVDTAGPSLGQGLAAVSETGLVGHKTGEIGW